MVWILHTESMDRDCENKKVAITAWEGRVSPMFDAARTLLVAEVDSSGFLNKQYEYFKPENLYQLLELLTTNKIKVLICGAVTSDTTGIIESSGVTCISFIAGKVDEVLLAYNRGYIDLSHLKMPGCNVEKKQAKEVL